LPAPQKKGARTGRKLLCNACFWQAGDNTMAPSARIKIPQKQKPGPFLRPPGFFRCENVCSIRRPGLKLAEALPLNRLGRFFRSPTLLAQIRRAPCLGGEGPHTACGAN